METMNTIIERSDYIPGKHIHTETSPDMQKYIQFVESTKMHVREQEDCMNYMIEQRNIKSGVAGTVELF